MSLESKEQKNKIVMLASIFGVCTTILVGFYWARVDSIMNAQAIRKEMPGYNEDMNVYDTSCGAPFSDEKAASELLVDIGKDCDSDCLKAGS